MQFSYQPGLPLDESDRHTAGDIPIDTEFNVAFADSLAQLEIYNKHFYRPNTYLHKWWARRCGSTFRIILKQLVENEKQRDYYIPGGLSGKVILDPMMGGGTTLHEAIRLGANVIGADIDPIPILQARASLSEIPLPELEAAFATFYDRLTHSLAPLFATSCPTCAQDTPLRFTLYGLQRFCACGPALFVDSLDLRQETDGSVTRLCPRCHTIRRDKKLDSETACHCQQPDPCPILLKSVTQCAHCGQAYEDDPTIPYYARYVPLVVAGQCAQHGLFFTSPTAVDLAHITAANQQRADLHFGAQSEFAIVEGPKSLSLLRRGIHSYLDLFSSRQLLYLRQSIEILATFDPLVRLNLALLVSTSLEFNSMLCGYKGSGRRRAGAIRHVFSLHAYSFPSTALENNLLYPGKSSGSLQRLFHDRIRRAHLWARQPTERRIARGRTSEKVALTGEIDGGVEVRETAELASGSRRFLLKQGSSAHLDLPAASVDFVVTDPPYFDSVQYSDLAVFFRVWLKKLVGEGVEWEVDLAQSAVEPQVDGDAQYTAVISAIFAECYRVLRKERGRLIFTFHHWNPKGWAAITVALKQAGFILVNRYVVHAENPQSVHLTGLNRTLLHDAILVLAAVETGIKPAWERPESVDKVDGRQFCYDCATLLGWLLESDFDQAAIEREWRQLLEWQNKAT